MSIDVQEFLADGTWTKPDDAVFVHVYLIGGGGGGRGGEWGSASTQRDGGPGGGGGGTSISYFLADDLPATVAVTVGQGGAGTAGGTVLNAGITAAAAGTASTFDRYARAAPGTGGAAQLTEGVGGAGSWTDGLSGGEANTSAESSEAGDANVARFIRPGGGGGAGGGVSTNNNGQAGREGSTHGGVPSFVGSFGGAAGGAAAHAGDATPSAHFFAGGGGGGGSGGGDGGHGADATFPGSGGGGGGGGTNTIGTRGGDGGDGSAGIVIVTTFTSAAAVPTVQVVPDNAQHAHEASTTIVGESYNIKPANETRTTTIDPDSHLVVLLEADTLYEINGAIRISGGGAASYVRLSTTVPVAFAAIEYSQMAGSIADGWPTATQNSQWIKFLNTERFNANQILGEATSPDLTRATGTIKTASACALAWYWGSTGATVSHTVDAGSWLVADEAVQE